MALTEVREEADLLRLRLHIARGERDAGGGDATAAEALAARPPPRLCPQACPPPPRDDCCTFSKSHVSPPHDGCCSQPALCNEAGGCSYLRDR